MLNYDDILQKKLDELESGQPLENVLEDLPIEAAELESLIRLAAAVRRIPHPEPGIEAVQAQRQQVLAAAQLHTRPIARRKSRPWAGQNRWKWLGGAAVVAAAGTFLMLFAIITASLGFWLNSQRQDTARVELVMGQVQVSDNKEGSSWKNLQAGDRVKQGQRLRTLGASYASLVFYEGSHTFISANADLTFARLDVSAGEQLKVEIIQKGGETWHKVTPLYGEGSFFLVRTPSGTASVHGTSFNVKVGQDGQARFAVNTGEVRVLNNGKEVTLLAGQTTAAHPNGEIETPTYQFSIQGSLLAIDDESGTWNVSGMDFQIIESTSIAGTFELGSEVSVTGRILADNTAVADTIQPAGSEEQTAFFTGKLDSMGGDTWIIGGAPVQVTGETDLDEILVQDMPVKVTFNILEDQTWLALKIEAMVESPDDPTPVPSATADPDAMPNYEFMPDELNASDCEGSNSFLLSGTLRNTAEKTKDYAANVRLGYLIDRGGEYISTVSLDPQSWERIEAGQTVNFNIRVMMTEDWANVPMGTEVKLRIFIASATNRPDLLNGRLTVTLTAGCKSKTMPTVTQTPTVTGTPTQTPTDKQTQALTQTPTVEATFLAPASEDTEANQCTGANPHPTGTKLAQRYGVSYAEIMYWFCEGRYGFGEIDLAYSLSRQSGKPVEEIFAMRASGLGWGEIKKQLDSLNKNDPGNKKDKKDKKDK